MLTVQFVIFEQSALIVDIIAKTKPKCPYPAEWSIFVYFLFCAVYNSKTCARMLATPHQPDQITSYVFCMPNFISVQLFQFTFFEPFISVANFH